MLTCDGRAGEERGGGGAVSSGGGEKSKGAVPSLLRAQQRLFAFLVSDCPLLGTAKCCVMRHSINAAKGLTFVFVGTE